LTVQTFLPYEITRLNEVQLVKSSAQLTVQTQLVKSSAQLTVQTSEVQLVKSSAQLTVQTFLPYEITRLQLVKSNLPVQTFLPYSRKRGLFGLVVTKTRKA
jgi:hypothetical protein